MIKSINSHDVMWYNYMNKEDYYLTSVAGLREMSLCITLDPKKTAIRWAYIKKSAKGKWDSLLKDSVSNKRTKIILGIVFLTDFNKKEALN